MAIDVPFNKPFFAGPELRYIEAALQGGHMSGDGPFTKKCHALLEEVMQVPKALLTTSCTHALEMAAILVDCQPGDEVIVPSFTFVSSVNAFVLRGAKPVFADIRPDTLNIDETKLEALITKKTKAIVVVHYAGVGCEMTAIRRIALEHDIPVIEDNAHGLFGKYDGQYLGTFGSLATQSFHETKNFTCGEGGALLINDPAMIERAEIIREKGTNRSRFFRGQVDKYTWVDVGSSYLPAETLAAYLLAQLEMRDQIQTTRERIWTRYAGALREWADATGVRMPVVPDNCEQTFHMFYLLLPDLEARTAFIAAMRQQGIMTVFHYVPLHLSQMGGGQAGDCPVTEEISDRLVRLPLYNSMTDDEQSKVIDAVRTFNPVPV